MSVEHPVVDVENANVEIFYRCRRCGRAWERSFGVTRWFDDDGGLVEVYRYNGVPVPSPRGGPPCAFCGSLTVDWAETPLPPAVEPPSALGLPRPVHAVPWPSWRTWPRDEWPQRRTAFPFLLPLRPQLHPRTFRFP
ncbi:hypothetical protein BBK14_08605 [Parafrankia soli]|uniref:Uncharacterized protein n=1 Tax=Parafrankia soli TaxID=2599596 RepID=A0A1S1PGP2_9ACTN|nr:hypothetical protein [Parafrankia soli]OHV20279.1 hypothetical protein BBK14_08605 [Parafrankia soli]